MKNNTLTILFFCLFYTLSCDFALARIQEDLDSIETVLNTMPEDSGKVQLYHQLFYQFEFVDSVKARHFLNLGLSLAQDLNYLDGLATTYMQFAFLNDDIGKYDKALEYYAKSLEIRIELQDDKGIGILFNNMGIICKEQGRYPEALEFYHKALAIAEKSDNKSTMALAYNNIGILHDDQRNYSEAIAFFQKALTLAKGLDNKLGVAGSYNNLGIIYEKQDDYTTALNLFQQALDIYDELGDTRPGIASTYNNTGLVYFNHPNLEESVETSYHKSLDYYGKALKISEHIGDQEGITASYINMGNSFTALREYQQGIEYLDKALILARNIGSPYRQKEAYEGIATLYERQGDYAKALYNYEHYTLTKDSLFNEEKSKDLGKLEAKHEFETAELQRKREEKQRLFATASAESRRNNLQYSGILIFIVALFAGVFFLGKFSIPIRLAEGMIFFTFLLFFEFTLVLLDPYIEAYSSGAPAIKLGFNALLAALIFPLHSFFEERLKGRIIN